MKTIMIEWDNGDERIYHDIDSVQWGEEGDLIFESRDLLYRANLHFTRMVKIAGLSTLTKVSNEARK